MWENAVSPAGVVGATEYGNYLSRDTNRIGSTWECVIVCRAHVVLNVGGAPQVEVVRSDT